MIKFIGLVNYYRNIWIRRSHRLQPLTNITSANVKFKWTAIEKNRFDKIKWIVARNILLSYPDFKKWFYIHINARKFQLCAFISQERNPIEFYILRHTGTQKRYTVTEKELLSIVYTLNGFLTILLVQKLKIYDDH